MFHITTHVRQLQVKRCGRPSAHHEGGRSSNQAIRDRASREASLKRSRRVTVHTGRDGRGVRGQ